MDFPEQFIDELCEGRPLYDPDHGEIRIKMELAGYDPEDEPLVKAAVRAVRQRVRDARLLKSATGRLSAAMVTQRDVARMIGMPPSTYQAMASGRIVERFGPGHKDRLRALIQYIQGELATALDMLHAKK